MSSLNQVTLIGNLGKAPEVMKTLPKGKFVRLSLATTKKYKDAGGKLTEQTQWHTVFVSNSLGTAAADYLTKGNKICVTGELRNSEWTDKNKQQHFTTAVYAQKIIFLSKKPAGAGESELDVPDEMSEPMEPAGEE